MNKIHSLNKDWKHDIDNMFNYNCIMLFIHKMISAKSWAVSAHEGWKTIAQTWNILASSRKLRGEFKNWTQETLDNSESKI